MSRLSTPTVSVVVPTHNRLEMLKQAIASVEKQTIDRQLVVVDDASSDNTWEWLDALDRQNLLALRVPERSGVSLARNLGLEHATGRYVLFLDDDDLLRPRALERLMGTFVNNPDATFVAGAKTWFDERGHRKRLRWPRVAVKRDIWPDLFANWRISPGQVLFRNDDLRRIGGFKPILMVEMTELFFRLGVAGPAVLIPHVVADVRLHSRQWRSPDYAQLREDVILAAISSLPAIKRERALRMSAGCQVWERANAAFQAERYKESLMLHVAAAKLAPTYLTSPLLRPAFVAGLAKSASGLIVGRRVGRALKSLKRSTRELLKQNVGAHHEFRTSPPVEP